MHVLHIGGGILLSQQLWLLFERKKKQVHVLHVGGGYEIVTHMLLQVLHVGFLKKLVLTLVEGKLHKYRQLLT